METGASSFDVVGLKLTGRLAQGETAPRLGSARQTSAFSTASLCPTGRRHLTPTTSTRIHQSRFSEAYSDKAPDIAKSKFTTP